MGKAAVKTNIQKENEVTSDNTMKFVNKLIIDGEAVETAPQKLEVTINDKKLKLNCRIIPDNSITTAYTNSFVVPVEDKDIQVFYAKGGGVLSSSLYVDGKLEYSGVSMQGIFAIAQALFGVEKLTVDRLYIASNANRKKPPERKTSREQKAQ